MKVVSTTIRELYDHIATSSNTNQRGLVHTKIPRYVNTHYVLATVFQPYPLPYSLRKEVTSMLQLSYPRGGFKDSIPYRISLLYPPPLSFYRTHSPSPSTPRVPPSSCPHRPFLPAAGTTPHPTVARDRSRDTTGPHPAIGTIIDGEYGGAISK